MCINLTYIVLEFHFMFNVNIIAFPQVPKWQCLFYILLQPFRLKSSTSNKISSGTVERCETLAEEDDLQGGSTLTTETRECNLKAYLRN